MLQCPYQEVVNLDEYFYLINRLGHYPDIFLQVVIFDKPSGTVCIYVEHVKNIIYIF